MTIRAMSRSDVPTVATLEREIYPQPWSARVFFDELGHANRSYVVVDDDGDIVGYGGLMLVEADAHITTLGVAPGHRRRRLGTRILLALVERAIGPGRATSPSKCAPRTRTRSSCTKGSDSLPSGNARATTPGGRHRHVGAGRRRRGVRRPPRRDPTRAGR